MPLGNAIGISTKSEDLSSEGHLELQPIDSIQVTFLTSCVPQVSCGCAVGIVLNGPCRVFGIGFQDITIVMNQQG